MKPRPALKPQTASREARSTDARQIRKTRIKFIRKCHPPNFYCSLILTGAFLHVTKYTRTQPDYKANDKAAHLIDLLCNY